jgi:hypothetical protein
VGFEGQEYSTDIEVREKPGTPGILQTLRAALAMELKEMLGPARIAAREEELTYRVHAALSGQPGIDLMGGVDPSHRLPIFSFNVRVGSSWLHPRFVTTLLNDLFGIQSRAGCSCAAPYGHRLLHIDERKSREFQRSIACGNIGLKPGWARVNFHFLHTDGEADFICRSILFVAEHGKEFLPLYRFDMRSGSWRHRDFVPPRIPFGLEHALTGESVRRHREEHPDLERLFQDYLAEAGAHAGSIAQGDLKTTEKDLIPFVYV